MDAFFASAAEYFQGSGSGFVSVAAAEIPAGAGDVGMARHAGRQSAPSDTLGEYPRPCEGLRHRRGLPDRFAHARRPHAL